MTILELIISIIGTATQALGPLLSGNKTAAEVEALAAALVKIAQAAANAYATVKGQPIDLSALQPIEPVPEVVKP